MRRSLKKLLSFSLAVAVMAGSMYKMPVSAADAAEATDEDAKRNGDLVMVEDYIYDSYKFTYNRVGDVLASNTDDNGYYTADSEICIINGKGEQLKLLNKNDDGTAKYKKFHLGSTSDDGLYLDNANGEGMVYVSSDFKVIGEGKGYSVISKYKFGEETIYLGNKSIGDEENSIDVLNENGDIIGENIFVSKFAASPYYCRFDKFGEGYVAVLNNGMHAIVLNESFEEIYSFNEYCIRIADDYLVCISEEKELYTINKNFEKTVFELEEMDSASNYSLSDPYYNGKSIYITIYDEKWNRTEYTFTDSNKIELTYKPTNKSDVVEEIEGGFLIGGKEVTVEQLLEYAGVDMEDVNTQEDVEVTYWGSGDSYVLMTLTVGDVTKRIVFSKKQDYALEKALIAKSVYVSFIDEEKDAIIVDGFMAQKDGWISTDNIYYRNSTEYYIMDNDRLLIYDYADKLINEVTFDEITALMGDDYEITGYSQSSPGYGIEFRGYSSTLKTYDYVYLLYAAKGDLSTVIKEAGKSDYYDKYWYGYVTYTDEEGKEYVLYEGQWLEIGGSGNNFYWFKNSEGNLVLFEDYTNCIIIDSAEEYIGSSYAYYCFKNIDGTYSLTDGEEVIVTEKGAELIDYNDSRFRFKNADGTYSFYFFNYNTVTIDTEINLVSGGVFYKDDNGKTYDIDGVKLVEVVAYDGYHTIKKANDGAYVMSGSYGEIIVDKESELVSLSNGNCLFKNNDNSYTNYLYNGEKINVDCYVEIYNVYGDTVVLREEQEDGSYLYGMAINLPEFTYGDATGDDKINVMDAVLMKKHIAGFEGLTIKLDACDVNKDSRVNVMDAVMVLKYIAGFDVVLGE